MPARKRKDIKEEEEEQQQPGVNQYELQRQQLIARNRARLAELGIEDAVKGLTALAPPAAPKASAPKKKKRPAECEPEAPQRRSERVRGIKAAPVGDEAEEAERGSLPSAKRRRKQEEEEEEDDDDEAAAARSRARRLAARATTEKERLAQLELGGLVDVTHDEAVFIVVGSTGRHYAVRFRDAEEAGGGKGKGGGGKGKGEGGGPGRMAATCECMDHRCRKRDCKHILLCAREVGLLQEEEAGAAAAGERAGAVRRGDDWRAAVRRSVERLGAADEADVRELRRKRRKAKSEGQDKEEEEEGEGKGEDAGAAAPAAAAAAASASAAAARLASRPDLKPALAFM